MTALGVGIRPGDRREHDWVRVGQAILPGYFARSICTSESNWLAKTTSFCTTTGVAVGNVGGPRRWMHEVAAATKTGVDCRGAMHVAVFGMRSQAQVVVAMR